jgi:hypothetical protein
MRSNVIAAALLMLSGPAFADEDFHVSSEGHQYAMACNESGYRLTSRYPVARYIENGVKSTVEIGEETLLFGKACTASSKVLGAGKWCWANGGFNVEFESGHSIGFPRQELSCEDQSLIIDGCGC